MLLLLQTHKLKFFMMTLHICLVPWARWSVFCIFSPSLDGHVDPMGGRAGAGILIQRQEGQLLVLLSRISVQTGVSLLPGAERWGSLLSSSIQVARWVICGGSTCMTMLPTENSDPNVNKALPLVLPALPGPGCNI